MAEHDERYQTNGRRSIDSADYDVYKSQSCERGSSKSRERDKNRNRGDKERESDRDKDRERDRRVHRHREKDRKRNRDRGRDYKSTDSERRRNKDRNRERSHSERSRDRDKRRRSRSRERSERRSRSRSKSNIAFMYGDELLEIYSVDIEHIDGGPRNLYGTIQVSDIDYGYQDIYNRDRNNSEKTQFYWHHEIANLAGLATAILGYDYYYFRFNLMHDHSPSLDKELIKGVASWHNINCPVCDQVVSEVVEGKYGTAYINFATISDAVKANVEVTLIHDTDGDTPNAVWGTLSAFNSCIDRRILLFCSEDCIFVRPEERIPLLRSFVVVPLDGSLTIEADLLDNHGGFVRGQAHFSAKYTGVSRKCIKGQHGEIVVKVTWSSNCVD